ncbi:energy-coupling factor ABC transporter ATP-binding protein [Planctomycetota bacterium]
MLSECPNDERAGAGFPLLEIRDLVYVYPDQTRALDGVSFSVPEGGRVALVGPNGSGKTTLLLHLNGLFLPQEGTVRVAGLAVSSRTVRETRRKVGLLFQDPDDQLFMPTLLEDVAFGPLNLGLAPELAKERALTAIAAVRLSGKEERPPHALSGGQKRLAALAGLLSMNPQLLALDEPSAGLDPRARRGLAARLLEARAALLVASHDLEFCLTLCDRAVVLDGGRVIREGPIQEVFSDSEFMLAHGLERPHSLDHLEGVHRHRDP